MAIYETLSGRITDINVAWQDKSGLHVEDFICQSISDLDQKHIKSGKYIKELLILERENGELLPPIDITVVPATYDFDMVFYGLRVNGVVCTDPTLLMQYKEDPKTLVEAGIAIRSVTSISDKINNNNSNFLVTFEFNSYKLTLPVRNIDKNYFTYSGQTLLLNIPEGEKAEDIVAWIDVSDLFKRRVSEGLIKASFTPAKIGETVFSKIEKTLHTKVTNEVIKLIYEEDIITKLKQVQVQFDNDTAVDNYNLIVFNNNQPVRTLLGSFIIDGLEPGLNQLIVRAEHSKNKNICTDWFSFDVICTEGFTGTTIAVNGVSSGITNNGVATLYKLFIYSTNREEIELTTYLEDNIPSSTNPMPTQIIKSEFIQASSYNRETNATEELSYKKYIEVESEEASKYLLIKTISNGITQFYKFKTASYSNLTGNYTTNATPYIKMDIEKCNTNYTYIKRYSISKNYDQITGQINNLFSTKLQSSNHTLIEDLESSDGWGERDGITYLKLSKQGKSVLKEDIGLSLNDNFTIELGFRTYNISNKSQSILNIGNLTLFPTCLGWDYNEGIYSKKFLKRSAQFQEGLDTHVVITVTKEWTTTKNDPYYPNYLGEGAQNVFDLNVSRTKINLMRIYINGCIDREIELKSTELNAIKNSKLHIEPKSADIDLYLFRVYNSNPLSHKEVILNYISFLPFKTGILSKESVYNKNDILDEQGKISWEKCQGKINTLLFIYHKDGRFPNRFWGDEDNLSENDKNEKIPCTLIINYADPVKNVRYGGILDKLQCKGQGSSAMRYLIWNVNSSLNKFKYPEVDAEGKPVIDPETGGQKEKKAKSKFKPFGNLWIEEELTELLPEGTANTYTTVEGYYPMPTYDDEKDTTDYKYTKMVGKVNFASSMQSHKLGACKLYDDAYKSSLGTNSLPSGGKKAVHEEPFMYFYIETDTTFDKNDKWKSEFDCDSITYDKILELGKEAKFMGFLTWGPGKGDDACSGFDEDKTPHYLMLEGGENTDPSVNFQRPWQALQRLRLDFVKDGTKFVYGKEITDLKEYPTVTKEQSLLDPSALLLIDDESIVYMNRGAWDIDYGFEEIEVGDGDNKTIYYDIPEGGSRVSLKIFREFYDNVYKWDFTSEFVESNISEPLNNWNQNKKYCVLSSTFKINNVSVQNHKAGDVYRFDEPSNSWVRAGVYYDNGQWERLNFSEEIEKASGERVDVGNEVLIKDALKALFTLKVAPFLKLNDIAFHQAFIKFLCGTDNRAKNTYFLIIGPMYHEVDKIGEDGQPIINEDGETETEFVPSGKGDNLIRLIGDDLDTILATDNNGLQSKPYNLIEDSYDESFEDLWGDVGNIFFKMFDKCYESDIKKQLFNIVGTAGLMPSNINNSDSYFYRQFFKIQEDFPAIAYNITATIYYENAQLIKNIAGGKAVYGFKYTNNDVEPIEQSHGSCLESEKQFMKERIAFLSGYAGNVIGLDNSMTTSTSDQGGKALKMKLDFIPMLDFYPTYLYEKGVINPIGTYTESEYDIIKYKAVEGQHYEQIINENQSAINLNLFQVNLYKTLTITGLLTTDVEGNLASTTELIIDNDIIKNNPDLFIDDYPVLNLATFSANLPVVEKLSLRNLVLPSELNLESFHKLRELDLTGSVVSNVIFPQTGLFEKVILPGYIKIFELYNNPKLTEVIFEDTSNLEILYIDGCKCSNFNISDFCENLNSNSLSSVTLRNLQNVYLTEEAVRKLLIQHCEITGEITIVNTPGSTEPKDISFLTKQELVNKFGDIVTGSNGLKINFKQTPITQNFDYNSEVNAFYNTNSADTTQSFGNLFGISVISGNDVKIVNASNPFNPEVNGYLDISYSMPTTKNATIDTTTGTITLTGPVDNDVEVTIVMKTIAGQSYTRKSVVSFKWKAPSIGNFAYIDGTFGATYNPSKTLVGLVYAKEGNENSGKVYIIGKEYSNTEAHYSGYSTGYANSNADTNSKMFQIYKLVELAGKLNLGNYQPTINSYNSNGLVDDINYKSSVMSLPMSGKEDTLAYVLLVESTLLPKFSSNSYVINDSGYYKIGNISNLNAFCESLENIVKLGSALAYPYFYSAYLYEPTPKVGESIDEQYKQGNWYAPSVGELSRIIYYRGYSAGGSTFVSNDVRQNIDSKVSGGSTVPIFSLALASMGNSNMPSVWNNIVGSGNYGTTNNITTSVNSNSSDADNYSYQVYSSYENSQNVYYSRWALGGYSPEYYYGGQGINNAWRYTTHQGIPFTEYEYSNPLNA